MHVPIIVIFFCPLPLIYSLTISNVASVSELMFLNLLCFTLQRLNNGFPSRPPRPLQLSIRWSKPSHPHPHKNCSGFILQFRCVDNLKDDLKKFRTESNSIREELNDKLKLSLCEADIGLIYESGVSKGMIPATRERSKSFSLTFKRIPTSPSPFNKYLFEGLQSEALFSQHSPMMEKGSSIQLFSTDIPRCSV